ncbi:MAG: DUF4296 domain-containing protein [Balneolaceae bacterium]
MWLKSWLGIITLAFSLVGCSKTTAFEKPKNLLTEDVYIDVFYEMQLLKVLQFYHPAQDTVDSLNNLILDKYQVDGEDFLASHRYYQSQVAKQVDRIDLVLERLEAEVKRFNETDSLRKAQPTIEEIE